MWGTEWVKSHKWLLKKPTYKRKSHLHQKKVLFSTSQIPLAVGASCVTFSATLGEPTPSTLTLVAEKSLTHPLPLHEIQAWKKMYFFFCWRNSLSLPNQLFFMLASVKKSIIFKLKLLFFNAEITFFTLELLFFTLDAAAWKKVIPAWTSSCHYCAFGCHFGVHGSWWLLMSHSSHSVTKCHRVSHFPI
jgi:hypothetical protein